MRSVEEQLAEAYAVADELHQIEVRLRNALDTAHETLRAEDDQPDS